MNTRSSFIISIITIIVAVLVMIGWFFDVGVLKSVVSGFPTMRFTTAVSFFFSGFMLYCSVQVIKENSDAAFIGIIISSLVISILMATLIAGIVFNFNSGVEQLFLESGDALMGRPATPTIFNFICITVLGLGTFFGASSRRRLFRILGAVVAGIGSLAVIGYAVGMPLLYYQISDISVAMAFHTAILFVLLGIGFMLIGNAVRGESS